MFIMSEFMKEKAIDIGELRIKIDQLNEKMISGLKTRSRFPLNKKIFSEEFNAGNTWIMYRLKKEQSLDSEFGRYLYYDQHPFIFSKEDLSPSKIKIHENKGFLPINIDFSKKIMNLYKKTINELCEHCEDRVSYGETTKIDVENILTLNERTVAIGEQVAGYKITKNPELLKLKTSKKIRKALIMPKREKDVIQKMKKIAQKYDLGNDKWVKNFAKALIDITLDSEVNFILNSV
jgi:chorismate mutase